MNSRLESRDFLGVVIERDVNDNHTQKLVSDDAMTRENLQTIIETDADTRSGAETADLENRLDSRSHTEVEYNGEDITTDNYDADIDTNRTEKTLTTTDSDREKCLDVGKTEERREEPERADQQCESKGDSSKDPTESMTSQGEGEEEEPERQFTDEDLENMFRAARHGDIEELEDLLNIPGADIDHIWFGENMLMTAIKSKKQEMAEFLIDNGINKNFEKTLIHLKNKTPGDNDQYSITCRQMAYDYKMTDIVDLIDELNGDAWPFRKKRHRLIRLRRLPTDVTSEYCKSIAGSLDCAESVSQMSLPSNIHTPSTLNTDFSLRSRFVPERTSSSMQGTITLDVPMPLSLTPRKSSSLSHSQQTEVFKPDLSSGYSTLSSSISIGSLPDFSVRRANLCQVYRDTKSSISRRKVATQPIHIQCADVTISRVSLYMGPGSYGSERKKWTVPKQGNNIHNRNRINTAKSTSSDPGDIWHRRLKTRSSTDSFESLQDSLRRSRTLDASETSSLPLIREKTRQISPRLETQDTSMRISRQNTEVSLTRPINKRVQKLHNTGFKKYSPAGKIRTATESVTST